jgi:hypothetical protein
VTRDKEVRAAWLKMSADVSAAAIANKQSQDALAELGRRYRILTPNDRAVVDRLLAEQVQSEDENVRFDALALVDEFKIGSAVPALRGLADWLEHQEHPGAPYEWAKVNRILGNLVTSDG